jgi:hypothetical protein
MTNEILQEIARKNQKNISKLVEILRSHEIRASLVTELNPEIIQPQTYNHLLCTGNENKFAEAMEYLENGEAHVLTDIIPESPIDRANYKCAKRIEKLYIFDRELYDKQMADRGKILIEPSTHFILFYFG